MIEVMGVLVLGVVFVGWSKIIDRREAKRVERMFGVKHRSVKRGLR